MEVNSYWGDGPLTNVEKLCMRSFLKHGIGYNLYAHDHVAEVPPGVELRDAEPIVPRSKIFRYPPGTFNGGSLAGFANLFRYALLERSGGWWVDADVCCLAPIEDADDELFLFDPTQGDDFKVSNAILKAPPHHEVLRYCVAEFALADFTKIVHGETGPRLITKAVQACGREGGVQPNTRFYPVPWWECERLFFDETVSLDGCTTVHFWNAMVTARGLDKNARYPAGAPIERLKREYLGDA